MEKRGYALWDLTSNAIALRFDDPGADGNGRPMLKFVVPGTSDAVHCPAVGDVFAKGRFLFAELWTADPGAPSAWHSAKGKSIALADDKVVETQLYSAIADLVPEEATALQFRRALRQLGRREAFETYVKSLPDGEDRDYWVFAPKIVRNSDAVIAAMTQLGVTAAQVATLFRLAATL